MKFIEPLPGSGAHRHSSGYTTGQGLPAGGGRMDLEGQERRGEEVVETPTMLHIMGQNNLLQRTGFRGGDAEQLED
jgi:hypothetical protein